MPNVTSSDETSWGKPKPHVWTQTIPATKMTTSVWTQKIPEKKRREVDWNWTSEYKPVLSSQVGIEFYIH